MTGREEVILGNFRIDVLCLLDSYLIALGGGG